MVGDALGAAAGVKDGFGVGLPATYVGTSDGVMLGADDGLQLGKGVGDPGT